MTWGVWRVEIGPGEQLPLCEWVQDQVGQQFVLGGCSLEYTDGRTPAVGFVVQVHHTQRDLRRQFNEISCLGLTGAVTCGDLGPLRGRGARTSRKLIHAASPGGPFTEVTGVGPGGSALPHRELVTQGGSKMSDMKGLTRVGVFSEKGIDVWLALEVLELAFYKRFDVSVLITGDRDFVPLARKLNALGTRVMLLGWTFEYVDANNETRSTRTSQHLIEEVTYPIIVSDEIEDRTRRTDPIIRHLFMDQREVRAPAVATIVETGRDRQGVSTGEVIVIKEGYGFIKSPDAPNNAFFHHSALTNCDFNSVGVGDHVAFFLELGDRGHVARDVEVQQGPRIHLQGRSSCTPLLMSPDQ
jgi:cold shock CspA family protein